MIKQPDDLFVTSAPILNKIKILLILFNINPVSYDDANYNKGGESEHG